jgi:hypothetical protein
LAGISDERIKFHHIISELEQRYAAEMEEISSLRHTTNPTPSCGPSY